MTLRTNEISELTSDSSVVAEFPLELLLLIAERLNLMDVIMLSMVCRNFYEGITNQSFWRARAKHDYPGLVREYTGVELVDWRLAVLCSLKAEVQALATEVEWKRGGAPLLIQAMAYVANRTETPLHLVDRMHRLIDLGYGINTVDSDKHSPLFHAVRKLKNYLTVERLVNAGVDWQAALHDAIQRDHVSVVVALVLRYKDKLILDSDVFASHRFIALNSNIGLADKLLPAMMVAKAKGDNHALALLRADDMENLVKHCCCNGNVSIVMACVLTRRIGPNYQIKDSSNTNLLPWLCERGDTAMVEEMMTMAYTFDVRTPNQAGQTAYQIACLNENWPCAYEIAIKLAKTTVPMAARTHYVGFFMFRSAQHRVRDGHPNQSLISMLESADRNMPIPVLFALAENRDAVVKMLQDEIMLSLLLELGVAMEGLSAHKRICK